MRKLLISILIALLLLITIYSVIKGLSIGNIKILGFNNIKVESEKLDNDINQISKLKEQDYKKTLSDIESNAKTLLQEKEKYATLVSTSTDSEIQKATHGEKYEQDFLWAKIGNHATAIGVNLKFDVRVSATNKEAYDLHFTVGGDYTNITEFVMALENDKLLEFRIENFKLAPNGGSSSSGSNANTTKKNNTTANTTNENTTSNDVNNTNTANNKTTSSTSNEQTGKLQATFVVRNIEINIDKTKISTQSASSNKSTSNTVSNNKNTTTEGTVTQ